MDASTEFGPLLRSWRHGAGLSQSSLAERAEVSARHLSFLETGRAAPSREMVLVLANALDMPLRERNALLTAGGFAPVYRESPLDGERMERVRRALGHLLNAHEPYGAVVVDRLWNVLDMNGGAMRMMGVWLDADAPEVVRRNVLHATFHPEGLRKYMVDWESVAAVTIARLMQECVGPGGIETRALMNSLLDYPGVPAHVAEPELAGHPDPFLPVHLRRDGLEVRFFTMVGTLGTPLDVTAQELRIESYFPADDATDAWVRSL